MNMRIVTSDEWADRLNAVRAYGTEPDPHTMVHKATATGEEVGRIDYPKPGRPGRTYWIDEPALERAAIVEQSRRRA